MRTLAPLAVMLTVSSWIPPAVGQKGGEVARGAEVTLRETIDVKEVVVDAVVTDRTHAPIVDLEPDDFVLKVAGKKARILSVLSGRDLRESVSGRVTIVVLFDERHLQPAHRNAILEELLEPLVAEMTAHPTWVALAALGDRLDPLLPPTRDVDALRTALTAAGGRTLVPSALREQQRRATQSVRDVLQGLARTGSEYQVASRQTGAALNEVIDYGNELTRDTRATLEGLGSLVDALSFVPGRKVVLLITDGLPNQPLGTISKTVFDRLAGGSLLYGGDEITAQGSTENLNNPERRPTGGNRADFAGFRVAQRDDGGALKFQQAVGGLDCSADFDRVGAMANTHRVTFYPLKPPVTDSAIAGLGEKEGGQSSIVGLSDMRSGLEWLARKTGGLVFDSDNGVGAFLRQANEDYAAYYALSFRPPDSMAGSGIRELVLRVRRHKSRIRYRASYLPIDLQERMSSQAWGTLLFGWQENVHELKASTTVTRRVGQELEVQILLSLPIGKLVLVPQGAIASGSYRVVMQLMNERGVRLEPAHVGFEVKIPVADLDEASEQFFGARTGLLLAPGRYDLAIGLWEENSGKATFVIQQIEVGVDDETAA